jgi:molecular chaperone GrpE (heat shock protein)
MSEVDALWQEFEDQQKEIEQLIADVNDLKELFEQQRADQERRLDELRAEIEAAKRSQKWETAEAVGSEVEKLRGELEVSLDEVQRAQAESFDDLNRELDQGTENTDKALEKLMELQRSIVESVKAIQDDITEGKAHFAVKIVRDRLRARKFLSKPADKLGVFRSGELGIDVRQAEQANRLLADLQKRVDEICLIRHIGDI